MVLDGRHFNRPAEAVAQGQTRRKTPRVAAIDVVEGNGALVEGRGERRIQSEVGAAAGVCLLGYRNDSENGGVVAAERAARYRDAADARIRCRCQLIHRLVVDAAAIVGARMLVEVVLVDSAELEEVIALQPADVVAEVVVESVPIARTGLLRVDVIGDERLQFAFAERFERAAESCGLRDVAGTWPRPPVTGEAVVEVVGQG